ncbi:hypothetical protein E5288_WYG006080 [Bos mutus]|uniref:Uncharacterized protein n=1 Tax=Bos mutus TaxID=72004 RepID=A0A6B0R1G5_9CETA|nr:hypothetical protein [Bos mutus]
MLRQPSAGTAKLKSVRTISQTVQRFAPSRGSAFSLMRGYFRFTSTVTANIQLIPLLLASWSRPSEPGGGDHTSNNNGWHCRQDS